MPDDILVDIEDLQFNYDGRPVLQGINMKIPRGKVVTIMGGSGCGKTTLLRLIAGLERPSAGRIAVQGRPMADAGTWVAPEARPVGFVFQGLALFPHLTVQGNVGFGLADRPRAERERRVREELAAVGLGGLGDRYPHQLSGGQQQRVAIDRSLVRRPALMLMDEPFSDLDPATRAAVRQEVLRILRAHGTGAVVVTHDREDAFHLADRICRDGPGPHRTDRPGSGLPRGVERTAFRPMSTDRLPQLRADVREVPRVPQPHRHRPGPAHRAT